MTESLRQRIEDIRFKRNGTVKKNNGPRFRSECTAWSFMHLFSKVETDKPDKSCSHIWCVSTYPPLERWTSCFLQLKEKYCNHPSRCFHIQTLHLEAMKLRVSEVVRDVSSLSVS